MSDTSDSCKNYGKHDGPARYWMCHRCKTGLESGCADFKTEGQSYIDWLRENSIVLRLSSVKEEWIEVGEG